MYLLNKTAVLLAILCGPALAQQADRPLTVEAAALGEHFGIALEQVRLSAAGRLLDLRYRVVDAGKAHTLFARTDRPALVHDASGLVLATPSFPRIGAMGQSAAHWQSGRTYFALFANPDRRVAAGDSVTLTLGEVRVPNLTVQ